MQSIIHTNDQTHIAYTDSGIGPPMLFIHGLGSNAQAFMFNTAVLSQHFRCITIDLPGYGESSKNRSHVTMTYFAEQVLLFLDHLQLDAVTLVGHSMGAQIALQMVHLRPGVADHLVLLAPAGFETFNPMERQWMDSMFQPSLLKNASHEQIMQAFYANFYAFPDEAEFMVQDRLRLMQSEVDFDFYCALVYHATMAMLDEPVFHLLKSIHQKTLIIFGEEDQLIPNQILHAGETTHTIAEQGANQLPHSQLQMISSVGHFVMFEEPNAVNQAILDFLIIEG